jgi:hypothetical protein
VNCIRQANPLFLPTYTLLWNQLRSLVNHFCTSCAHASMRHSMPFFKINNVTIDQHGGIQIYKQKWYVTIECSNQWLNYSQYGISSHIGTTRLLGFSCHIPFFITCLAAWIDIEHPPTGLQLSSLENSGYTPGNTSPYPYRIVSEYMLNWWATPGNGSAVTMVSWKPNVQDAFTRYLSHVSFVV